MTRLYKALLLLTLASSCAKYPCAQEQRAIQDGFVKMTLNLSSGAADTKAGQEWGGARIRDLYILEFDSKGYYVYGRSSGYESNPEIPVLMNQKVKIYVIANPTNDFSGIATEIEFLNSRIRYAELSVRYPEMIGRVEGIFSDGSSADIELQRMSAKVQVDTFVLRVSSSIHDYVMAWTDQAYLERTPSELSYGFDPYGTFVNAYDIHSQAGCDTGTSISAYSTDGSWKVWEFQTPLSMYSFPNSASEKSQRTEMAIDYTATYKVGEYSNGEYSIVTKAVQNTLHLILPPLMPNTIYELEKIVVNQPKTVTVEMASVREQNCMFKIKDMASGEVLGFEKGIMRHEIYSN